MQHYAIFIASQRIDDMIAEATRYRITKREQPSLRERIAHFVSTIRSTFAAPSVSFSR